MILNVMEVLGPLYTPVDALKFYGWRTFAHQPISDSKRMLTKRAAGGSVYVGDDYLGSIEEQIGEQGNYREPHGLGVHRNQKHAERAERTQQ